MDASCSDVHVEEKCDPADSFEVIEFADTLKLSPEEKFVAKVENYNAQYDKYQSSQRSVDHYFGKIQGKLGEYIKQLQAFLEELARQTERDWLIEPEFSDLIEPQFFAQYQFLSQLYAPVAELDERAADQLLRVRQLFFQQALLERMDIGRMTENCRLQFREQHGRLRKPAAACDVPQMQADVHVILTGLDIIDNLLRTTTQKLFEELGALPAAAQCAAGADATRPLVVFFDHLRRWERFLRARFGWFAALRHEKLAPHAHQPEVERVEREQQPQLARRFRAHFAQFRALAAGAERLCLRRGHAAALCHALREWAAENVRAAAFAHLHEPRAAHAALRDELAIVQNDLLHHRDIFNLIKRLADDQIDPERDQEVADLNVTPDLRRQFHQTYLRYLQLDVLTKRAECVLAARAAGRATSADGVQRWVRWASAEPLDLAGMPPTETLEPEQWLRRAAHTRAHLYRDLHRQLDREQARLQQCMAQLRHAADQFASA